MSNHSPARIGRKIPDEEWAEHAEAAIALGNVEQYAKENHMNAGRFSAWMAEHGYLERMQTEQAARNLISLRHVINSKGRMAAGYHETIGEIQRRILQMLVTTDEDGNVDTVGILNLSKASKLNTDSLLTILGDPTTIQAVSVTVEGDDEASAHYRILERIAAKAANRPEAIDAAVVEG